MYSLHPTEANVTSLLGGYNSNLYVFCLCVQYMAVNMAVGTTICTFVADCMQHMPN